MATFHISSRAANLELDFEGTPTRQKELVRFALRTLATNAASEARFKGTDQKEAVIRKMAEYGLKPTS